MISKEHHKHAKLARPTLGKFARNEWAILGTNCSRIQNLSRLVIAHLASDYACAYVDARHPSSSEPYQLPGMLDAGAVMEYTDAIENRQLFSTAPWGSFHLRQEFQEADFVLVNGNHHEAASQVVIIDPEKEDSLRRRLHQLSNVRLFIFVDSHTQVFDFIRDNIPAWEEIPRLQLNAPDAIAAFFSDEMKKRAPIMHGLVLAGGHSVRMGRDKGAIEWHGVPQREYLAELLQPFCSRVYISCRAEQEAALKGNYETLTDTFTGLGPYGAILSALRAQPDSAWLVVACDLPLLNRNTLEFLTNQRSVRHIATAFHNTTDQLPEPLIAIWEPKSYPVLLSFLAQGYSCPRKVLINAAAKIIAPPDDEALTNVNTPEDMDRVWSALHPGQ